MVLKLGCLEQPRSGGDPTRCRHLLEIKRPDAVVQDPHASGGPKGEADTRLQYVNVDSRETLLSDPLDMSIPDITKRRWKRTDSNDSTPRQRTRRPSGVARCGLGEFHDETSIE
jgi:hypothetical protein